MLAWRHLRQNTRWLRPTTVVLVLLSLPSVTCYQYNTQHTASFLASADSVRGEVTGRNVLGNLLVTFPPNPVALPGWWPRRSTRTNGFSLGIASGCTGSASRRTDSMCGRLARIRASLRAACVGSGSSEAYC